MALFRAGRGLGAALPCSQHVGPESHAARTARRCEGATVLLWDSELTLEEFERRLCTDDLETKAYLVGKLMRQAKPDDVFTFVTEAEIRALWGRLLPYLGRT